MMKPLIGLKPLADLCRRTGTTHAAGVDARTIWQRESQRGSVTQRRKLQLVSQAVDRGSTLAEAFRAVEGYFPPLVLEIVEVGERTGHVAEALNRLARHYEYMRSVRSAFLAAIAWPVLQLGIAILVIGGVIGFMGLFPAEDAIDLLGFGLVGTRGVLIYFSIVGAVLFAVYFAILGLMRGTFSAAIMSSLMRLPAFGRWLQLMAMSRMAWSLEMAVESGMDAKHCAQIALRSTQNKYFTQHGPQVNQCISRGEEMHEAFASTAAFSQDFLDAVEVGEQTGRLSESMNVLSRQYEEQSKAVMQVLAVAGGLAIWILVAAVIVFFIFRFALFYVNLLESFM